MMAIRMSGFYTGLQDGAELSADPDDAEPYETIDDAIQQVVRIAYAAGLEKRELPRLTVVEIATP